MQFVVADKFALQFNTSHKFLNNNFQKGDSRFETYLSCVTTRCLKSHQFCHTLTFYKYFLIIILLINGIGVLSKRRSASTQNVPFSVLLLFFCIALPLVCGSCIRKDKMQC